MGTAEFVISDERLQTAGLATRYQLIQQRISLVFLEVTLSKLRFSRTRHATGGAGTAMFHLAF
jgi:hypothetical protein